MMSQFDTIATHDDRVLAPLTCNGGAGKRVPKGVGRPLPLEALAH